MRPGTANTPTTKGLVEAALRGKLTEAQARRLANEHPEVLALALRAASQRIAEWQGQSHGQHPSPSTPSGMVPLSTKPNTPKRRKKPGAKKGHSGHRRKTPERIDERETHRLKRCPCCGGPLQRCQHKRTRTIEDIPEEIELVVTEHTIHRDYCPNGQKHVEPVVPDAMPKVLEGWYEQIGEQARSSAHLHARRSGSRTARRHNPGRLCAIRSGIAASPLKCGPNLPTTSIADRGDCISFLL